MKRRSTLQLSAVVWLLTSPTFAGQLVSDPILSDRDFTGRVLAHSKPVAIAAAGISANGIAAAPTYPDSGTLDSGSASSALPVPHYISPDYISPDYISPEYESSVYKSTAYQNQDHSSLDYSSLDYSNPGLAYPSLAYDDQVAPPEATDITGADVAGADGTGADGAGVDSAGPGGSSGQADDQSWVDDTHTYVANSAHELANWIDHFFGSPRDDIESAYSSLRLTFESEWEEGQGRDNAVRLRGKVHLPRINERLSLIFTDEEGEISATDENVNRVAGETETTRLALQYKAKEKGRARLDYRLGLRSSLKLRASARYRYEIPWGEHITQRFVQTLYFIDGEGFGSRSRYEYDHLLGENYLFRWSNNARFYEKSDGVEWSSRFLLGQRRNEKSAMSYFTWVNGDTRPNYLTTSYGLGVRYRKNFYRPWLFYELEPAYAWKRELPEDDREGVLIFSVRLEIAVEQLPKKKK